MLKYWVLALAAAGVLHSSHSKACSCAPDTGFYGTVPEAGATDVPTDVVPWANTLAAPWLIDSEGNEVPASAVPAGGKLCSAHWELVPDAPLEPNSTYSLVTNDDGTSQHPAVVSFTTGEAAIGDSPPAQPELAIASFDASRFLNSCVYSAFQACLVSEHEGLVEVQVLSGDAERSRTVAPLSSIANVELGDGGEACVEVRARALNGMLSEPIVHCASFESRERLESEDYSVYVSCDAPQVRALLEPDADPNDDTEPTGDAHDDFLDAERSKGCSLSTLPTTTPHWLPLLGLLVFWRRARPRY